jgi:hypothetical protein
MENLSKAIRSFNDLIDNTEELSVTKAQISNSNRIHPPAPAPPPTPALPSIKDFDMVVLLGLHDTVEDTTTKAKTEELITILRRSMAILNKYAEVLALKNRVLKTDGKAWQALDYFPLLEKGQTKQISISKTAKGSDIAAEIINAIKNFKPAEDKELIRFSEYLDKIARSLKQKKHSEHSFDNNNNNNLLAFAYGVDVIKNGATTDYRQNIKLLSVEFGNDLSGVRCDGNREVTVNITISRTDYTLNYAAADQRNRELFHSFLNTREIPVPENDPAFFEGYFKRP